MYYRIEFEVDSTIPPLTTDVLDVSSIVEHVREQAPQVTVDGRLSADIHPEETHGIVHRTAGTHMNAVVDFDIRLLQ